MRARAAEEGDGGVTPAAKRHREFVEGQLAVGYGVPDAGTAGSYSVGTTVGKCEHLYSFHMK